MKRKTVIPALGEAHAQRAIGGNPKPIGGEGKVQLIIFNYLFIMVASKNKRFLARLIREN